MKAKRGGGGERGARRRGERTEEEESSAPQARWAVRGPSALPLPTRPPSRSALLCRAAKQKRKTSSFILLFSRLSLPFDKVGGGSEEQKRKTSSFVLLFSRLSLPLSLNQETHTFITSKYYEAPLFTRRSCGPSPCLCFVECCRPNGGLPHCAPAQPDADNEAGGL